VPTTFTIVSNRRWYHRWYDRRKNHSTATTNTSTNKQQKFIGKLSTATTNTSTTQPQINSKKSSENLLNNNYKINTNIPSENYSTTTTK
jgi:hypothetical protein